MSEPQLNQHLRAAMSPEQYAQLMASIAQHVNGARAIGRKEAIAQGSVLRGAAKSWTVWFGSFLLMFPDLWLVIAGPAQELVLMVLGPERGAKVWEIAVRVVGLAIIVLRFKTTGPVTEKALKPVEAVNAK